MRNIISHTQSHYPAKDKQFYGFRPVVWYHLRKTQYQAWIETKTGKSGQILLSMVFYHLYSSNTYLTISFFTYLRHGEPQQRNRTTQPTPFLSDYYVATKVIMEIRLSLQSVMRKTYSFMEFVLLLY